MNLTHYFGNTEGVGILATADANGKVDLAIYETPQVIDDNTIALNMLGRLSYKNLQTNPNAVYMFIQAGEDLQGKRFYLAKISQRSGIERIRELKANNQPLTDPNLAAKHFVCFRVENIRPLVGSTH